MKLGPKLPDEWEVTLPRRISGKLKPCEDSHAHQSLFQSASLLMNVFSEHQLVCLRVRVSFHDSLLAASPFPTKKCIPYILDAIFSACSISFSYAGDVLLWKELHHHRCPPYLSPFQLCLLFRLSFIFCPSCFFICFLQVCFKTLLLSLCGALEHTRERWQSYTVKKWMCCCDPSL